MAGEAAKKRAARNAEVLKVLLYGTAIAHVLYILVRYWLFNASFSRWTGFFYLLLAAANLLVVYVLHSWSEGVSLDDAGLIEYLRDVVYFSWIILGLGLLTDFAYLLLLVIPGFAVYKLCGVASGFGGGGGAALDDDEQDERKEKKKKVTNDKRSRSERLEQDFGIETRGGRPKFRK